MCGIVGYIGKHPATELLLEGLEALEYRGYDSAGIAVVSNKTVSTMKTAGRVPELRRLTEKSKLKSTVGIGHTRWATHGKPTSVNAHPHTNTDQTIAVVHNGIIENYLHLKAFLEKEGVKFTSQTDTEVIPHLIDYHFKKIGNLEKAFAATLGELRGAFAIAMVSAQAPGQLFIAKLSSPLVIGISHGAYYVASDQTALPEAFSKLIFLEDFEYAVLGHNKYALKNFQNNTAVERTPEAISEQTLKADKGAFEHYLLKEIHDIPETIRAATAGRIRLESQTIKLGGLENVANQLTYIDRIVIVACGTSYYAGLVGEYLIEEVAGIPVEVCLASEFKYRQEPFSRSTALLAISQSGETADTIAALKKVEDYGVLKLGVVNVPGSTIARMTDAGVYCHAGPEHSVASTKAFVAQTCVLALIALSFNRSGSKEFTPLMKELLQLDKKVDHILAQQKEIQKIAKKYAGTQDMLYIGRRYGYPTALEGALKLKEVSYIHAEGYAAGEMKHGPLAMIDKAFPTFAVMPHDDLFEKMVSNIEEIRARGGKVIGLSDHKSHAKKLVDDLIVIPKTLPQLQPIVSAVALDLFAYFVATEKGLDVDRPRNLAKSVTVE